MAHLTRVRRGSAVSSTTNSTSWNPTVSFTGTNGLNTAIASGERVIWALFLSADGSALLDDGSAEGWTETGDIQQGSVTGTLFTLETTTAFAAGGHPAIAISSSAAEQYSCTLFAYKAATNATIGVITAASANGSSTNSNPASITNSSGSSRDVTVFVGRAGDSTVVATAAPTNYGNLITQAGGGSNGASSNGADRQLTIANSASEDPGTFTSASEQWACWTVGFYEIPGSASLPADVGTYSMTGTAASSNRSMPADAATMTMTGTDASFVRGKSMPADIGSMVLTGVATGLLFGHVLVAERFAPNLAPDPGFDTGTGWVLGTGVSISGSQLSTGSNQFVGAEGDLSSTIGAGNKIRVGTTIVNAQSSGQMNPAIYLTRGFGGNSFQGSLNNLGSGYVEFEYLHTNASPIVDVGIANFGANPVNLPTFSDIWVSLHDYLLTGTDVTFAKGRTITADPGSYAITGTTAGLLVGRSIVATAGSYALTGTATGLLFHRSMPVTPGSYSISGTTTGLLFGRSMPVTPGSYALTGTAANLRESAILMPAAVGSYSLTGTAAGLSAQRLITAGAGSYLITGADAGLSKSGGNVNMSADVGSYALTGTGTSLLAGRALSADPGSYAMAGEAVSFMLGRVMTAAVGSYSITGTGASLTIAAVNPWQVEPDPPPTGWEVEDDPDLADDVGAGYSAEAYDPLYYETDSHLWEGEEDPGPNPVVIEPDPGDATSNEGAYYSLFYDPSFYDTTARTWVTEDGPPRVAILEET